MALSTLATVVITENGDNCRFNNEWTNKYSFIILTVPNAKPMCLLCNECVSVVKEHNMKRHFETKQAFGNTYPEGTVVRSSKVEVLITS